MFQVSKCNGTSRAPEPFRLVSILSLAKAEAPIKSVYRHLSTYNIKYHLILPASIWSKKFLSSLNGLSLGYIGRPQPTQDPRPKCQQGLECNSSGDPVEDMHTWTAWFKHSIKIHKVSYFIHLHTVSFPYKYIKYIKYLVAASTLLSPMWRCLQFTVVTASLHKALAILSTLHASTMDLLKATWDWNWIRQYQAILQCIYDRNHERIWKSIAALGSDPK